MIPFSVRELKRVLLATQVPDELNGHPWAGSAIAAAYRRDEPQAAGMPSGQLLLDAVAAEFRRALPNGKALPRGRLNTQWLQYGLLAARYFAPFLTRRPAPPSLADA
jgi:hypothetical protein